MMTMVSRALQLQRKLEKVKCPKCGKRRLVQRRPRQYDEVRCFNCGGLFSLKKKVA
jgi:DNA-directed RNA polymerase subunit RPC12/RpoP